MFIALTALLFHVMASHGVVWEGVGSAYLMSYFADVVLAGTLLGTACYVMTERMKGAGQ